MAWWPPCALQPMLNVRHLARRAPAPAASSAGAAASAPASPAAVRPAPVLSSRALHETTDRVIAIGSSTGGVQAIEAVLTALPRTTPGIVIVQHMPEAFTAAFAERLNKLCAMEVKEARARVPRAAGAGADCPGRAPHAAGRSGAQYVVVVRDGPLVNRHKPSVDVLFKSVRKAPAATRWA